MKPVPEEQAKLVGAFREVRVAFPLPLEQAELYQSDAFANYVVPMLVEVARRRGDQVVDDVPRYSSASHAGVWTSLLAAIERFAGFTEPYFDFARTADPLAESILRFEGNRLLIAHVISSFDQGLWQLVDDGEGLRIHLAEPMRRSALHLVADKARFLQESEEVQAVLMEPTGSEALALTAGIDDLRVFYEACPDAWARLAAGLPFSIESLGAFRAFMLVLGEGRAGRLWFARDELIEAWHEFVERSDAPTLPDKEVLALIDFHALTVVEGQRWGIQTPLLRVGEQYVAWLFAYHVLIPNLNFLVLVARRYEQLWSRTLGAELDRAADWIAARLPKSDRLLAATRRRRKGVAKLT